MRLHEFARHAQDFITDRVEGRFSANAVDEGEDVVKGEAAGVAARCNGLRAGLSVNEKSADHFSGFALNDWSVAQHSAGT